MDNRGYIKKFVLKMRRNEDGVIIMRSVLRFACLGAGILTACMLISLIWHFYYAELAGIIAIAAAAVFGLIWGFAHKGNPVATAVNLDSFGTKEKIVTAFEEITKGEDIPEGSIKSLQIEDAAATLRYSEKYLVEQHKKQQRKLLPWKELLIFLLITAAGIGTGFIPSKVREEAVEEHEAKVEAEEIIEEIEKIEEKLEEIEQLELSPEEKEALENMKEALEASRQDLKKTKDKNSLKKAKDKLGYKVGDMQRELENISEHIPENANKAIKDASEMMNEYSKQQNQKAQNNQQNGENGENGENGQNQQGQGGGQGQGQGNGSGTKVGNDFNEEYISIDKNLQGKYGDNSTSQFAKEQNGLVWEGEKVPYSSVLGEYQESAYEGIEQGRYPDTMSEVIKNYFGGLADE